MSSHVRRPPRAELLEIRARMNAWNWIANQIKENLRNNR